MNNDTSCAKSILVYILCNSQRKVNLGIKYGIGFSDSVYFPRALSSDIPLSKRFNFVFSRFVVYFSQPQTFLEVEMYNDTTNGFS